MPLHRMTAYTATTKTRRAVTAPPTTAPTGKPLSDEDEDASGVAVAILAAWVVLLGESFALGEAGDCVACASAAASVGVVFVAATASAVAVVVVAIVFVGYKPGIVSAGTVPWF